MENNTLQHHGILGQKWGVRRYQNKDGSLTAAGKKRRDRYERAADASQRDADDLRKHGYIKEAEAVQRVADKNRSKSKTANAGKKRRDRYERAADAAERDADDLRKHGYIKEAEAVQRVADKNRSKSKTAIAGPNNREDHNKAHDKSKNKSVESMSDAELRARINRLQLEQQYAALSSKEVNTGKDYVNKIIKASTTVATLTSKAIETYNNIDKIKKIITKTKTSSK